jgi:hypothetical protein
LAIAEFHKPRRKISVERPFAVTAPSLCSIERVIAPVEAEPEPRRSDVGEQSGNHTVKEFEVKSGAVFACCPIDLAPMVALGCRWVWGDQNMRSLAVAGAK